MLATAREHHRRSQLIAQRAAREAVRVEGGGLSTVGSVLVTHQVAQAQASEAAVRAMLDEQGIQAPPVASLQQLAFTTSMQALEAMLGVVEDGSIGRLVASLVADAGRAAEHVAVAARPRVQHVRMVNPPCCSRCALLAGRVYPYSSGFLRHPGCDCVMVPTTVANPRFMQDPDDLVRRGLVTGLSKADREALTAGADLGRVVNVRSSAAGLREPGRVLSRAGRLTPEAIYRRAGNDRAAAQQLLAANGYLR